MGPNFKNAKNIIYAPMAGISDSPARRIARMFGADMTISGLISSEAMIRKNRRTWELARFDNSERPIGLQLFGANPDSMAGAAAMLEELNPDFLDINFGCPAKKVVGKNGGSSILKDLALLGKIVRSVVDTVSLPVTVKLRAGWDSDSLIYIDAGKVIEDAGASAITLHARTKMQGFSGNADWSQIAKLKKSVGIPVIGNGDISSPLDARKMFQETGCDCIMIGRASLGNPWIFKRTRHFLDTGELLPEAAAAEKIDYSIEHFKMMTEYYGVNVGARKMRAHYCWYLKGFPKSAEARSQVNRMLEPSQIIDTLLRYRDELDRKEQGQEAEISQGI